MILGGTVLLTAGIVTKGIPDLSLPWSFYLMLFWLAIVSAGGFAIWFRLLDRVAVSELNLWKFIIPIFGAIFSWIFLKAESPDIFSISGMLFVAGAIIHSQWKATSPPPA
jgi:drug/metabolite transporter (DMT)-like permease